MKEASEVGHNVADLETKKAQAIKAFKTATTSLMRQEMEKEAEDLDRQIKDTRTVRNKLEITEQDIDYFIKRAKYLMEHPSELLLKPVNTRQQQTLFGLVFEGLPTYEKLVNGTPKLALVFDLITIPSHNNSLEKMSVRLQGLDWNTLESTVLHWNSIFGLNNLSVITASC